MIRSMTGYGRGQASAGAESVSAQVRSVNGRGRELRFRLPPELFALESRMRERVAASIARGRVDVNLERESKSNNGAPLTLDEGAASAVIAAWRKLAAEQGLAEGTLDATTILRVPGVMSAASSDEPDVAALEEAALAALDAALAEHRAAREKEGAALAADLAERHGLVARLVGEIRELARDHGARVADTIRARLAPLLEELPIDEARLAQEAALAAQRADVTEELVRLDAHLERWSGLEARGSEEIGRQLEFLVQEIRREVNTIGAKLAEPAADERTLAIKAELEKVREQAANLE